MEMFKNQKFLTSFFIFIGLLLAGVNFLIYQGTTFNSSGLNLQSALVGSKASQVSPLLPDIKKSQSFTASQIRDTEINKIKPQLPINDSENHFTISYLLKSKILLVAVTADNINQYRERKALAEAKLVELGSDNICDLVALWSPSLNLKSQLTRGDLTTSNCP